MRYIRQKAVFEGNFINLPTDAIILHHNSKGVMYLSPVAEPDLREYDVSAWEALKVKPYTVAELSKELNRRKNTVYRTLQRLIQMKLVIRETKTIKEGGYYYLYSIRSDVREPLGIKAGDKVRVIELEKVEK